MQDSKQPVVKAPLHSIGAASRVAALLLGHTCPNVLPRRALPRGAQRQSRCNAGFHHGLLVVGVPGTIVPVLLVVRGEPGPARNRP